jgi:hypothetical protein
MVIRKLATQNKTSRLNSKVVSLIDTPHLSNLPSELEMFDRLAEETKKEIGVNTYSDAS